MFKFDEVKPESGDKIVAVCDDGCTAFVIYVLDGDENGSLLYCEAEDAHPLEDSCLKGSIWYLLPVDYPIHFVETWD